jgi:CysZ protein
MKGPLGFIQGFRALPRGTALLFQAPGLGSYLAISLLANFILVALLALGGWLAWTHWGEPALADLLPGWLAWAAGALTIGILALAAFLLFPLLIPLVATPFLDPLARKVESHLLGRPAPEPPGGLLPALLQDLQTACKLLLFGLLYALICLATAPFALGFLLALPLGSWLAAVSWLDHPLARRGFTWREKKAWIRAHLSPALGFGLAVSLSFLLPVYNLLLAAPAAAAGASLLYIRLSDHRK